ncbi:hypothetical protein [Streptomyces parvus]|uniref:Uncharacterized protein n=1 Tax=Streptomyces parvus TaxID=66428 RepID=A0A7K3RNX6_9ACTN|nr:hypothetical protein [Streptomyces parvus]NEC16861.1 hypothetical protein [Streptomyces parvus]
MWQPVNAAWTTPLSAMSWAWSPQDRGHDGGVRRVAVACLELGGQGSDGVGALGEPQGAPFVSGFGEGPAAGVGEFGGRLVGDVQPPGHGLPGGGEGRGGRHEPAECLAAPGGGEARVEQGALT